MHRDLKPGNILVTPEGGVKLLDFGIAKLLREQETGEPTTLTAAGARFLTPDYASPEQLLGQPISTASDVFSLGVVLFELLAGRHPFRAGGEIRTLERDATRPSLALADDAATLRGEATAHRLRRRLAGELDNIVLTALRKEPQRRYPSVDQLAEDLRRHLDGRPVLAQKDTAGYRLRKFVRRHRLGVAAAALVVASLLGGTGAATWQARRAEREAALAQRERVKAERISAFLQDMLRSADPRHRGREVTVADVLDDAGRRAAVELAGEPDVLAAVQTAIGVSYRGLGLFDQAEPLLRSGLELRRRAGSGELVASLSQLGLLYLERGRLEEAERLLGEALDRLRASPAPDSLLLASTMNDLGSLRQQKGEYAEAAGLHRAALDIRQRLLPPNSEEIAGNLNDLGVVLGQQGDFAAAEPLHRRALEIARRVKGPEHPEVATAMSTVAFVLTEQQKYAAADSMYRELIALRRRLLGPEHPEVAWALYGWASMLQTKGDYDAAAAVARQVLALRGRTLPDEHPMVSSAAYVLGISLMLGGEPARAEPVLREAVALRREAFGADHWLVASAESTLGECLTRLRHYGEAEPLLLRGYERLRAAKGDDHVRTREAAGRLADYHSARSEAGAASRYRARAASPPVP